MNAPGGVGETGAVYRMCQLFSQNPGLNYRSIVIHENGMVDVQAVGTNGVLKQWVHAIPEHKLRQGLVPTGYGADEADVIEALGITVTVRRPMVGPGGVA